MKMTMLTKTTVFFTVFFLLCSVPVDAGPIKKAWKWITNLAKPVHGTYHDGESNKTAPLTTFDRGVFSDQRELIRAKVINEENGYKAIYLTIYDNADTGTAVTCGNIDEGVCGSALLAKNAAFVYLMGFDKNGDVLDETTTPKRSDFYTKAVSILDKCDDEDRHGSFVKKNNQQFRAAELVMLLQAHDYLMTAKSIGLDYHDADQTASKESLVEFAQRLYRRANNDFGGALNGYNNTTLKVGAALGMAAVILNDQGTYFWNIQKKPDRWANAAHAYINRTLWTGPGLIPMTGSKGPLCDDASPMRGYAEGPDFFAKSMEDLLPFFITFNNFVNEDMTGRYRVSVLNLSTEKVRNYKYNPDFDELYKWYNIIRMPNQNAPCFDDSRSDANTGVLALSRKSEHNVMPLDSQLKIYRREADYLASFNIPRKPSFKSYAENPSEIIVRTPWATPLSQSHYLYLNGERGTALNGNRRELLYKDFGHEQADAASFIISAGEDVLAIDPGYRGFPSRPDMAEGHHHNVITLDGDGPDEEQKTTLHLTPPTGKSFTATAETMFKGWPAFIDDKAKHNREIEVNYEYRNPYYIINDYVTSKESSSMWAQFNLNGNGLSAGADPSFHIEPGKSNVAIWDYPCKKDGDSSDNWKMRATITTQIDNQTTSNIWNFQNGSTHSNNEINYTGTTSTRIRAISRI